MIYHKLDGCALSQDANRRRCTKSSALINIGKGRGSLLFTQTCYHMHTYTHIRHDKLIVILALPHAM